jgi:hypothetical protein
MRACRKNKKLWIALFVLVSVGGYFFVEKKLDRQNDGFSIQKIASTIPNSPLWDLPEISDEAKYILKQQFHYLGRGLQCYAFQSSDGKYVLKFMRHQRLEPHLFFTLLPNLPGFRSLKEQQEALCQKRVGYLFRSLKLAIEQVPEETGLLAVQLNKGEKRYGKVVIFDKKERRYEVLLDSTEFVLQKKAELVKPTLTGLMKQGKVTDAKERISQIFRLLSDCAKKGVCDTDGSLIRKNNLGFLSDRAIYIDTGKLASKESIKTKTRFAEDLKRLIPLYEWLKVEHPVLADHFQVAQAETLLNFECSVTSS